jgi:hypothetical protein
VPDDGGLALPDTPEASTGSVARGGDSIGRISASGGPEHERACSGLVLTVRWRTTGARSGPHRARFTRPHPAESTRLLGAFWLNRVTSECFPGRPRTVRGRPGFTGKKRYQTHRLPGAPPRLSLNPPTWATAALCSVTRCSRSLHATGSSCHGEYASVTANTVPLPAGPPRAVFPGVRGPERAVSLPRVQDSGAYSPPGGR